MNEKEKKLVNKLLDAWYAEARGNLYEHTTDLEKDLAKLDEARESWRFLLEL